MNRSKGSRNHDRELNGRTSKPKNCLDFLPEKQQREAERMIRDLIANRAEGVQTLNIRSPIKGKRPCQVPVEILCGGAVIDPRTQQVLLSIGG